jgi:hypothetical protein
VQKLLVLLALAAIGVPVLAFGCKHSTTDDNEPVETGPDGSALPQNADCSNIAPISTIPDCDGCTRSQLCCSTVLDCVNDADCAALRACIQPCKEGDTACSDACHSQHVRGSQLLALVSQCAEARCSAPCGVEVVVGDGG